MIEEKKLKRFLRALKKLDCFELMGVAIIMGVEEREDAINILSFLDSGRLHERTTITSEEDFVGRLSVTFKGIVEKYIELPKDKQKIIRDLVKKRGQ